MEFEWDFGNLWHVFFESPNGITPGLVRELARNHPWVYAEERPGRSGTHHLTAPDDQRRFWTVVLLRRTETLWRPITGWPSANAQIRLYKEIIEP